jgi:hypothetical protein
MTKVTTKIENPPTNSLNHLILDHLKFVRKNQMDFRFFGSSGITTVSSTVGSSTVGSSTVGSSTVNSRLQ